MKYCIQYNKHSKILKEVDEFTINFNRRDSSLLDFLKMYNDKNINIYVEDLKTFIANKDIALLKAVYDSGITNFAIKIPFTKEKEYINAIKETQIPFFFSTYVSNWDLFTSFIELGVSDIYIVEELCFELDKVAKIAHENGVRIRTFPNVAQSQWEGCPDIKKFFIRPDDIGLYGDYVDVCEFYGKEEQIATYYKIYAKDQIWFGKLNEIIIGLNTDLDSRYMVPKFAERRISCGKSCFKGGKCQMCERIAQLSETLEEAGLVVKNK